MSNIGGKFKKWMAVGCSHGRLADPKALETVLKFQKLYKPVTCIHLGDFTDQTAFRTGARGTADESASIADDLTLGINFLKAYNPTHVLNGNHEDRLWRLADHPNEVVARAAASVITEIEEALAKAVYVKKYDIWTWLEFGDTKFLHGFWFNKYALASHAEHYGKVVMAHLHIASIMPGERHDNPKGYCVGTLANIPAMDYAKARRATARWSHGLCYGEYSDKECIVHLSEGNANTPGGWRLP